MKRIYDHAISLFSNECVFLNTSLGKKYHPILESGIGGGAGTWKSNHKGLNVDDNEWLVCDWGEAFGHTSSEESTRHSSHQRANQKRLSSNGCSASSIR
jgi:hypothetical protein